MDTHTEPKNLGVFGVGISPVSLSLLKQAFRLKIRAKRSKSTESCTLQHRAEKSRKSKEPSEDPIIGSQSACSLDARLSASGTCATSPQESGRFSWYFLLGPPIAILRYFAIS